MDVTLGCGARRGTVRAPASKSCAHRLLLSAALGERKSAVSCGTLSRDVSATADCLRALGAGIEADASGTLHVTPLSGVPADVCPLQCGESGSTLRFLLPVVGALGARAVFRREGRLAQRPLEPLLSVLRAHGMTLREDGPLLFCEGGLQPGEYSIDGGVSSQFVTGLLYALTLLGDSSLHVTGTAVSAPYVELTMEYIRLARAAPETTPDGWAFRTPRRFALPDRVSCEGDWSNAAPFLCIGALSPEGVTVTGLRTDSAQGDRAVVEALRSAGAVVEVRTDAVTVRRGALRGFRFDAEQTPDLVPALAALSACIDGPSEFVHAARLREKESDRLSSTASLLRALGAEVAERPDGQAIRGGRLVGGTADAAGDHRIAMAAAVAACGCTGDVTLRGAECVEKSYPEFWKELSCLSM